MAGNLVDSVIVGAEKAGTTFLYHWLNEDPAIYMPDGEPPFFEEPDYADGNLQRLADAISGRGEGSIVGIKRPNHLHLPYVHKRLYHHLPDVKYIVVLRDPVKRALSAYYHYMCSGCIPVIAPNEGFERILSGKYAKRYPAYSLILEGSLYGKHITHFMQMFSGEQALVLLYEDLTADALTFVQRAYRFLGVDDTFVPDNLSTRPQGSLYSIPKLRIISLEARLSNKYFPIILVSLA